MGVVAIFGSTTGSHVGGAVSPSASVDVESPGGGRVSVPGTSLLASVPTSPCPLSVWTTSPPPSTPPPSSPPPLESSLPLHDAMGSTKRKERSAEKDRERIGRGYALTR